MYFLDEFLPTPMFINLDNSDNNRKNFDLNKNKSLYTWLKESNISSKDIFVFMTSHTW